MSAGRLQVQSLLMPDDGGTDYTALLERDGVEIDTAPGAAACGAGGCQRVERLVRVAIEEFGARVVCPRHAAHLLKREAADR